MSKHTKEPWHTGGNGTIIYDKDGWGVASATVFHVRQEPETAEANARRIVAAVNACAGVRTETLERVPLTLKTVEMVERIKKAESQRGELLTALKLYEQAFEEMFSQCCSNGIKDALGKPVDCTFLNQAHSAAGRAIKKVEGR